MVLRHLSKSGKKTPGVGWYWSGCAGKAKWGLEIGGLAAIDINNHTAFHLEAVQTINSDDQSLSDWYAEVISERKDTLKSISKYLVADAWFSKKSFVDKIISLDMHLVSRLRDDADLRYLSKAPLMGKRGRTRKYTGKIDTSNIDQNYFIFISEDKELLIYATEVYSKALKRNILLVHVTYSKANGKDSRLLYFSTDISMDPPMMCCSIIVAASR